MIIKENEALEKKVGPMLIKDYKINPNFSGTLITIDGTHGLMKNIKEDRIYFVIEGEGKFIVNGEETIVSKNDLIFVPKNTPYNIIGKMTYFLLCTPEFKAEDDVVLE